MQALNKSTKKKSPGLTEQMQKMKWVTISRSGATTRRWRTAMRQWSKRQGSNLHCVFSAGLLHSGAAHTFSRFLADITVMPTLAKLSVQLPTVFPICQYLRKGKFMLAHGRPRQWRKRLELNQRPCAASLHHSLATELRLHKKPWEAGASPGHKGVWQAIGRRLPGR